MCDAVFFKRGWNLISLAPWTLQDDNIYQQFSGLLRIWTDFAYEKQIVLRCRSGPFSTTTSQQAAAGKCVYSQGSLVLCDVAPHTSVKLLCFLPQGHEDGIHSQNTWLLIFVWENYIWTTVFKIITIIYVNWRKIEAVLSGLLKEIRPELSSSFNIYSVHIPP